MIRSRTGFTLVELLIIIAIVGIIFVVILVAVDPDRRFAESRNAVRRQDVRSILEAIIEYTTDNRGNLPAGIDSVTASAQVLGTTSGCNLGCVATTTAVACLDLSGSLVETYLSSMPMDPSNGEAINTQYFVNKLAGGRIIVGACGPERSETIQVQR